MTQETEKPELHHFDRTVLERKPLGNGVERVERTVSTRVRRRHITVEASNGEIRLGCIDPDKDGFSVFGTAVIDMTPAEAIRIGHLLLGAAGQPVAKAEAA